jgi:protein-tyrosine phosphatase
MRDKIGKYNLQAIVDSCGMGGWHVGEAPDSRAQQVAKNHGLDISQLRGRKFSRRDFDDFDIIYAMDYENYHDIMQLARNTWDRQKVRMIMNEVYPNENISVPDPYYGVLQDYETTWEMIDEACEAITKKLQLNDGVQF